jgi:hypothetical protein
MYEEMNFTRLLEETGTWMSFENDWRAQCEALQEDFDGYAEATLSVVRDIIQVEKKKAGVFALQNDEKYLAMCQINRAALPGYDGPVLRVRFITFCPDVDLQDLPQNEYGRMLVSLLTEVLVLAKTDPEMGSRHIKFHLRSPADVQFFTALGQGLHDTKSFETVVTRGAWLYITLR